MRVVELQNLLLAALTEALGARGFRHVKREQHFKKKGEAGTFFFHIAFIQHATDVDATADMAVTYAGPGPDLKVTIGVELGNWTGLGQHRWRVSGPADIAPVSADIVHWFDRIAVAFFQRFASPAEALRVLDEKGREADLISPFPEYQARSRERLRAALERL